MSEALTSTRPIVYTPLIFFMRRKMMRCWSVAVLLFLAINASGQSSASTMWEDLKAKRDALPGLHQEFEVTREYQTARTTQNSKVEVVVDMAGNNWRERFV